MGTVGSDEFWGEYEKHLTPAMPIGLIGPSRTRHHLLFAGAWRGLRVSENSLRNFQGLQSTSYLSLSLEVF